MIKVVYLETLTRVRKKDAVDKVLFRRKMTLSNRYVKNRQTNYRANSLMKRLEHFDCDDVKEILVFVDIQRRKKQNRR